MNTDSPKPRAAPPAECHASTLSSDPRPHLEVSLAQSRQRIWLCVCPCEYLVCTPSIFLFFLCVYYEFYFGWEKIHRITYMCICIETLQKIMQQILTGVLSQIIHNFNLFSAYLNFLIHLNIYYYYNCFFFFCQSTFFFIFLKHLYWSIIALQWCVSFCFITK